MKPQSIFIDSFDTITTLKKIADSTCDELELFILLDILKTSGREAVAQAMSRYPVGTDSMSTLTTKQVYTQHGWLDVLTATPIHDSTTWACTFSHNPEEAYLLDKNGHNYKFRIYQTRPKPQGKKSKTGPDTSPKRTKDDAIKAHNRRTGNIDLPAKDDSASPNLWTESDFPIPLPEKHK